MPNPHARVSDAQRAASLNVRRMKMARRMDEFADALAEGVSVPEAGRVVGVHPNTARHWFRLMREGRGGQAR